MTHETQVSNVSRQEFEEAKERSKAFESKEIRALWWKQPYGELMMTAEKIETRTWDTKYRGLVLLCASKKPYSESEIKEISGIVQFMRIYKRIPLLQGFQHNILGKAFAIGRLIDSRPMTKDDESACFVKYREGLYCHVYEDVTPIIQFEMKGCQGWKKLELEILSQIEPLYSEDYKWW